MKAALRSLPRRETTLLVVAIALLVFVGVAFDRAAIPPDRVDSFSSYDAATGGYRAAYEMLGRIGIPVERFERRPSFLDASIETLVYVDPLPFDATQIQPTKADLAALDAWVRGGGALLYIGYDDAAAKTGYLHLPPTVARAKRAHLSTFSPALRLAGVARITSAESHRFRAKNARVLVDDGRGALVVTYPFGRGRVTAVVDRTLFTNVGIATGDRARLFAGLARDARGGIVAFDEVPHGYTTPERWWNVVPRTFAYAVVFGCLVLLVAFAGAAVRLGPPLVPVARDDRTSGDFIDALAGLYERKAAVRETLRDVMHATTVALARRLGGDVRADAADVASALQSDRAREAFAELRALAAKAAATERDLVRGLALAHDLRKDRA